MTTLPSDFPSIVQAKILSLQAILSATAEWRASVAKKYPRDPRNARAANLLASLAAEDASTLPNNIIKQIETSPSLRKTAEDVAGKVGYRSYPTCFADFLTDVLALADAERVELDRVFGGAK